MKRSFDIIQTFSLDKKAHPDADHLLYDVAGKRNMSDFLTKTPSIDMFAFCRDSVGLAQRVS